jgi:hypothetical protein
MTPDIQEAFTAIGAELQIAAGGRKFVIDIREQGGREVYALRYPSGDTITAEVLDVKPQERHLVLDIVGTRLPISGRYLCGHDEWHWFVASLPFHRRAQTVRGAMEMLKPAAVLREQKRKGVKHRRNRRKTAAYVRQGEWFFLPRPKMHVDESLVEREGRLVRQGGKPHRVQWLCRSGDGNLVFVRGKVSHPDHASLYLDVWHRVVRSNEPEPAPESQPLVRMDYLD